MSLQNSKITLPACPRLIHESSDSRSRKVYEPRDSTKSYLWSLTISRQHAKKCHNFFLFKSQLTLSRFVFMQFAYKMKCFQGLVSCIILTSTFLRVRSQQQMSAAHVIAFGIFPQGFLLWNHACKTGYTCLRFTPAYPVSWRISATAARVIGEVDDESTETVE